MNDDFQDRLRRTYRAVGENTATGVVEPRDDCARAAVQPSPRQRRAGSGIAAAAAVVLLLVGGLAVLSRTRPDGSASSAGAHVLPTWMPTSGLPLVSITSDANSDVIEYASDALSVTVRADRTLVDDFDGSPLEVRGGQTATVAANDDAGRVRWSAPDGPTVTIEWIGTLPDGLDSIAAAVDGLVLVDDRTWEAATEFGGFTRGQYVLRRQVGPVEVSVQGDLQSGLLFWADGNGFGERSIDAGKCVTFRVFVDDDKAVHTVLSRFAAGTATVTFADGTVATVELSRFVPGSALGVGFVEREVVDPSILPDVVCEVSS